MIPFLKPPEIRVGMSSDKQHDIFVHLYIYIHLRTSATVAISPPTTVIVITRTNDKNKKADILEVYFTSADY